MATDNKIRDNNSAALWTVAIIVIIAIAAWVIYKEYHKQQGTTYSSPTVSGTTTPETGNTATQ